MKRASASAKVNLALVVGPTREDGYHEVATVMQRIDLADRIELEPAQANGIRGFPDDTLVKRALKDCISPRMDCISPRSAANCIPLIRTPARIARVGMPRAR